MRRQERVGKAEICNFPTEKISVLKILIMSLNYWKIADFQLQIL